MWLLQIEAQQTTGHSVHQLHLPVDHREMVHRLLLLPAPNTKADQPGHQHQHHRNNEPLALGSLLLRRRSHCNFLRLPRAECRRATRCRIGAGEFLLRTLQGAGQGGLVRRACRRINNIGNHHGDVIRTTGLQRVVNELGSGLVRSALREHILDGVRGHWIG